GLEWKRRVRVEGGGAAIHPETTPEWLIVRYEFPALQGHTPLKVAWYDGGKRPTLVEQGKAPNWRNGVLFVGDKGMLIADYGRRQLLPGSQFAGFNPPEPFIPKSIGHHKEGVVACKTGGPTT